MHSNRKHIMMVKNKDQGVRKMVRTVINEPRITRKGLQNDLEAACTSAAFTCCMYKISMDSLFFTVSCGWGVHEALGVECINYSFICNTCTCCFQVFLETVLSNPWLINYCSDHLSDSLVFVFTHHEMFPI